MRVEASARTPGGEGREPGAARFGDALARAGRAEPGGASRGVEARARPEPGGRARRAGGGADAAVEDGGAWPGAGATGARSPAPPVEVAPVHELARAVRLVPLAIGALGTAGGAPLALSFGRSLDVELRPTAAGVEVVLCPEPALARAAEAELPRLVAALRVRGVAVASAVVRPRGRPGGRAR